MDSDVISERTEKNVKRFFLISGYLCIAVAVISFGVTFFRQKTRIENTHGWEKSECTVLARGVTFKSRKSKRFFY